MYKYIVYIVLHILCISIGRHRLEHVNGDERDPYTQTPQTHPSMIQMMMIREMFNVNDTNDDDTRYVSNLPVINTDDEDLGYVQ